ncbi:hypothetical protein NKY66_11115 [Sinorhizobium meliloti]|uniref:hypothetical protein n=1 Tax=Rhizobium meliloti TaxID=382 RepID=UPI003D64998D
MTTCSIHQQMILAELAKQSTQPRVAAFITSIRGQSPADKSSDPASILAVVNRDGEDQLERKGIAPEDRAGAILEVWSGGPRSKWATRPSYGAITFWKRTEDRWVMTGGRRQRMMGSGPDSGKLTLTPKQDALRYNQAALAAYAIRARFSGDRDD